MSAGQSSSIIEQTPDQPHYTETGVIQTFNSGDAIWCDRQTDTQTQPFIVKDENHDIAITMSSSRADPMLGLNILWG